MQHAHAHAHATHAHAHAHAHATCATCARVHTQCGRGARGARARACLLLGDVDVLLAVAQRRHGHPHLLFSVAEAPELCRHAVSPQLMQRKRLVHVAEVGKLDRHCQHDARLDVLVEQRP
eukprot:6269545-Prymnesium_polylepis.1